MCGATGLLIDIRLGPDLLSSKLSLLLHFYIAHPHNLATLLKRSCYIPLMATLSTPFAPPLYGRSAIDQMPDSEDSHWRQQYYAQSPMLTQQWPNPHAPHLSGIQPLDVRMYTDDHYSTIGSSHYDNYSDIDAGTPSTTGFPNEASDYVSAFPTPSSHLQIPEKGRPRSGPMHSPHLSHGSISPVPSPVPMPIDARPGITGLPTPPERQRSSTTSSNSSFAKGRGHSDEDGDYFPGEVPSNRGRKRQRIPHTAVERRYRENLNAHLDKLRQTVPTLASRNGPGAGKGADRGEGAKPSKCEILSGAIDHIGSLARENAALKNEVRALRTKITDLDAWYRANGR